MYNLEVNFLTQDGNMIAKLRGIIDTIGEDFCIVDVNGVGYLVFASAKTLGQAVARAGGCASD